MIILFPINEYALPILYIFQSIFVQMKYKFIYMKDVLNENR